MADALLMYQGPPHIALENKFPTRIDMHPSTDTSGPVFSIARANIDTVQVTTESTRRQPGARCEIPDIPLLYLNL